MQPPKWRVPQNWETVLDRQTPGTHESPNKLILQETGFGDRQSSGSESREASVQAGRNSPLFAFYMLRSFKEYLSKVGGASKSGDVH
jgi:hypothetical protein